MPFIEEKKKASVSSSHTSEKNIEEKQVLYIKQLKKTISSFINLVEKTNTTALKLKALYHTKNFSEYQEFFFKENEDEASRIFKDQKQSDDLLKAFELLISAIEIFNNNITVIFDPEKDFLLSFKEFIEAYSFQNLNHLYNELEKLLSEEKDLWKNIFKTPEITDLDWERYLESIFEYDRKFDKSLIFKFHFSEKKPAEILETDSQINSEIDLQWFQAFQEKLKADVELPITEVTIAIEKNFKAILVYLKAFEINWNEIAAFYSNSLNSFCEDSLILFKISKENQGSQEFLDSNDQFSSLASDQPLISEPYILINFLNFKDSPKAYDAIWNLPVKKLLIFVSFIMKLSLEEKKNFIQEIKNQKEIKDVLKLLKTSVYKKTLSPEILLIDKSLRKRFKGILEIENTPERLNAVRSVYKQEKSLPLIELKENFIKEIVSLSNKEDKNILNFFPLIQQEIEAELEASAEKALEKDPDFKALWADFSKDNQEAKYVYIIYDNLNLKEVESKDNRYFNPESPTDLLKASQLNLESFSESKDLELKDLESQEKIKTIKTETIKTKTIKANKSASIPIRYSLYEKLLKRFRKIHELLRFGFFVSQEDFKKQIKKDLKLKTKSASKSFKKVVQKVENLKKKEGSILILPDVSFIPALKKKFDSYLKANNIQAEIVSWSNYLQLKKQIKSEDNFDLVLFEGDLFFQKPPRNPLQKSNIIFQIHFLKQEETDFFFLITSQLNHSKFSLEDLEKNIALKQWADLSRKIESQSLKKLKDLQIFSFFDNPNSLYQASSKKEKKEQSLISFLNSLMPFPHHTHSLPIETERDSKTILSLAFRDFLLTKIFPHENILSKGQWDAKILIGLKDPLVKAWINLKFQKEEIILGEKINIKSLFSFPFQFLQNRDTTSLADINLSYTEQENEKKQEEAETEEDINDFKSFLNLIDSKDSSSQDFDYESDSVSENFSIDTNDFYTNEMLEEDLKKTNESTESLS